MRIREPVAGRAAAAAAAAAAAVAALEREAGSEVTVESDAVEASADAPPPSADA